MDTEFRLYNRLKCSFFDLIPGEQEPKQTKALGLVLSKSSQALDKFLELIFPNDNLLCKKLRSCRCIIDCEARQNINFEEQKSYRTDIILRFYERNIIPYLAIVIEAKGISVRINIEDVIRQVKIYKDTFNILDDFEDKDINLVTITKFTTPINKENIRCITWSDILTTFLECKNNNIIDDFCNFLLKINGAMKFYEEDVLSIPAGSTFDCVDKYGIYECPNNRAYQKYNKKVLYFSFRAKQGISQKLYKVKDVIPIVLGDDNAIRALNNIGDGYADRLIQYIQDRQKSVGLNMEEEKLVFFFNLEESITLPYPVKPVKNNTFTKCYSLSKYFGKPNQEKCVIL